MQSKDSTLTKYKIFHCFQTYKFRKFRSVVFILCYCFGMSQTRDLDGLHEAGILFRNQRGRGVAELHATGKLATILEFHMGIYSLMHAMDG
jgi:hypothetical protein